MNDQNRLGQDLNGALGGSLFNVMGPSGTTGTFLVPSAKVIANVNNSDLSAAATPGVTLSDISKVTTSDYTLTYGVAGYSLTRMSDKSVLFANVALPQTVDGLTIAVPTNPPVSADSWLIQPTRNGARDVSLATHDVAKIAAASPVIAPASLANAGTGKASAGSVDANYLAAPC